MTTNETIQDVPSPIDLKDIHDAEEWARTAQQRPGREDVFNEFARQLKSLNKSPLHILELGSGPGYLALHLLENIKGLHLSLLDFSDAMHDLAKQRLQPYSEHCEYITRDFKLPRWHQGLQTYDAVITNQAVHELRHKRHASKLHSQVKPLLADDGVYLVCDHFYGEGGLKHDQLYMSIEEQARALQQGGYDNIELALKTGSLALHQAS